MNKLNVILLVLVLASGLAVVTVQDQARTHHIALYNAQKQQTQLDENFSKLKLEQAKRANHQLIQEAAAAQRLHPPHLDNTRIIEIKK
ncbi:cell division protein FtsL [Neisseria sp. HSC-16F19]|nr:cell division protein FtsL [Neisseria sp. HSC-16F19]MCP2041938.1 cell division protein FtsL [Neisseria sp. HSC-16F19]